MKNKKYIIIGLSILFIVLSILIKTNLLDHFDNEVYKLITFNMSDITTNIYKVITFLGSTEFIIFLCLFFLILFIILKKKNYGIIIAIVLVVSTIVNNILKIILARPRPDVIKFVEESTYSFPSGHTMAAVSMYGILIFMVYKGNMNKKLKIVLISILSIIPVLVGLSRVYLGAHYISDVIGSFMISIILLIIASYIIDKKKWI